MKLPSMATRSDAVSIIYYLWNQELIDNETRDRALKRIDAFYSKKEKEK